MKRGKRLRGAVRRSRRRLAYARAHSKKFPRKDRKVLAKTVRYWEGLLRTYRRALKRPHPHLAGDLDCRPELLGKLERLARDIGRNIYVTSGYRSPAEQKRLYDNRFSNPYPVAFSDGHTCHSRHCSRRAADCVIGSLPIQAAVSSAVLVRHGLDPLEGDAVHVEG